MITGYSLLFCAATASQLTARLEEVKQYVAPKPGDEVVFSYKEVVRLCSVEFLLGFAYLLLVHCCFLFSKRSYTFTYQERDLVNMENEAQDSTTQDDDNIPLPL
jgi:hypothetical protein